MHTDGESRKVLFKVFKQLNCTRKDCPSSVYRNLSGKDQTDMKRKYDTDRESFISISTAWALGLICFSITQVIKNGKTEDFESVIFWSMILTLTAWLVFIRIPLNRINSESSLFHKFLFPILTTVYGLIAFTLLIGWAFIETDFKEVFIQAGATGLFFGLSYSFLTNRKTKPLGTRKRIILGYLTPLIIIVGFLWLFPTILPAKAFKFMPHSIQSQIIKRTFKDFKVGDDFIELKQRLPGWFDRPEFSALEAGEFNSIGGLGGLQIFGRFFYTIQVHCNKIIVLQYSDKEEGYKDLPPINGRLHEEPCR